MAAKHPLRRSCAFCRARKIKCSNETICEACRRQGADCIYDFEPPRPKSRTIGQDSIRMDLSVTRHRDIRHRRKRSSSGASSNPSPPGPVGDDPSELQDPSDNIAMALEQRFYDNFSHSTAGTHSSPWQDRIAEYHQSLRNRPENMTTKSTPKNMRYMGLLSLLTQDLVGLVTDQFSSLGCRHIEDGTGRFFLSGLASDNTQTMFDDSSPIGNPLSEYGQRQKTQLIDVWYSVHPLSFLVSKTLLLREVRDGTHDEVLLAVMLADSHFSIGDEVSLGRGQALLQWAVGQLRNRPLRSNQRSSNCSTSTGVPTRIIDGVSTAQSLMLLAWNALCSFQLRRAMCFMGLAGQLASEIKEEMVSSVGPMNSSRINGIDVFDVEKEIIAYLYWTTYSLSLWAFIQMGSVHFSSLLPTTLTPVFLPITEADSVIIHLDLVSDNFSTLQKQKKVVREMWPLAQISSVVAYIFAIFPQGPDVQHLRTTNVYQEINRLLTERTHFLKQPANETSSLSLVLVVYQTMAIHSLFPISSQSRTGDYLTEEVIERFISSAEEILQLFNLVLTQPQDFFCASSSLSSSLPDVFSLALDTCARALSSISTEKHRHLFIGSNQDPEYAPDYDLYINSGLLEGQWVQVYEPRLEDLTTRLNTMSRNDFLNQGRLIREVRKYLKARVRAYGGSPGSDSSGSPSPDNTRSMPRTPLLSLPILSSPDSEHLSTATTTVVYSSPPSTSPMDTSNMISSMPALSKMSPEATMTNHFVSFDETTKPDWQSTHSLCRDFLSHSAASVPTGDHLSIADMVDLQAWYPPMPTMMDFEIAGQDPMLGGQWDWPALSTEVVAMESDVGSSLHYFDRGNNKRR
ncbi:Fc.00g101560.m01.CDS01 [Cosmosporella sp. VM-42]